MTVKRAYLILAIAMILSLFGCKGNTQLAADIAEYGDGTINPRGTATRAQVAQILYNYGV